MSDATADEILDRDRDRRDSDRRVRRRYAADRRLRMAGIGAIGLAILLLGVLISSLILSGYKAFVQSKIELDLFIDPALVKVDKPGDGNYRLVVQRALEKLFPEITSVRGKRDLNKILSSEARFDVRDYVVANPQVIGTTIPYAVALSDTFDQVHKTVIPLYVDGLTPPMAAMFDRLRGDGVLRREGNDAFLVLDVQLDPARVEAGDYQGLARASLKARYPDQPDAVLDGVLAPGAGDVLRVLVEKDASLVGKPVSVRLPVASDYRTLAQGGRPQARNPRFETEEQIEAYQSLAKRGLISQPINWPLFFNADSRFPEQAGLAGAIAGSFYTLMVCFVLSFPIGIAAAVYLEEFAPRNRMTDLIEVNINNLAAVPSVVFGLLGLAVFIGFMGLPRSAPLVGGMVLALISLPTIIIATRAALKGVPPSIREAALGVGASKHQVMMHHVVPVALPGIMTGTIIGLAHALGETAPLLLVGMNAFIPSVSNVGMLDPATTLPTQIYSWADSPERGFVSRTSAAILVLLVFLGVMNAVAIFLRQRFEQKW